MIQLKAFCKVKNKGAADDTAWTEDFKVETKATAEQESREVVDYFNNTRKPYEEEREFISLVRIEEVEIPEEDDDDDDYGRDDDYYEDDYYDDDEEEERQWCNEAGY